MNKNNIMEILPLGSVVTLKKGTKKLMIVGRIQEHMESGKLYDYSAVCYPEGMLDSKGLYLFRHEDIERVYYVGLQEEEEFAFRQYLKEQLQAKGLL